MSKPLVSVCCLAYNHEKYIRQCLDGFIMQKTDFPFEVIVHDDASTDATADIIREYAEKYPDIIKPIFQTENQYSKGRMKYIYTNFIYPKAKGRYIAYCEGDDFWIDKNKLQKQVEILEEKIECHICVHTTQFTNEAGELISGTFPQYEMQEGEYSSYDFMKGLTDGYFFHTSSFMCRAEDIKAFVREMPEFYKTSDLDDVPLLIYFGQLGKAYYLSDTMSCYRRESIGSWTSTERVCKEKTLQHKELMVKMYEQYNEYTNGKYMNLCEHWKNNEKFMMAEMRHDFAEMSKPQYAEWLNKRNFRFRVRVKVLAFLKRK